ILSRTKCGECQAPLAKGPVCNTCRCPATDATHCPTDGDVTTTQEDICNCGLHEYSSGGTCIWNCKKQRVTETKHRCRNHSQRATAGGPCPVCHKQMTEGHEKLMQTWTKRAVRGAKVDVPDLAERGSPAAWTQP